MVSFDAFIDNYRAVLKKNFREPRNHRTISLSRNVPPKMMRDIMSCSPLDVFIPAENGGRGGNVRECLTMLEASSYESLPLSLMMGINGALFIQPVVRYADENVATSILGRFASDQQMGGLMITEPDYGSDALHMQTHFEKQQAGYHIQGTKHWAGLTGWADYWMLTAREKNRNGSLSRDIAFFIHDTRNPGVEVEEYFDNLGLYMLPYGRNVIDCHVPESHKLVPQTTGIKLMLDMLHRSRMQFPGMAMGFLRRIMDDALAHVTSRNVGGKSLITYDQVKERIVRLQSYFTTCSAMCAFTSEEAPITKDLSGSDVAANSIKSVVTDMMQDASQSFLQLVGAQGYKLDHMAGKNVVDSRPFQIFEGSNDILYQQIAESIIKKMRKAKVSSLYEYLKNYELTNKASDYLKKYMDFRLDTNLTQRKQVELGKVLGHIVSLNMVIQLGERGFHNELIKNTLDILLTDIRKFLLTVHESADAAPAVDIDRDDNWASFIS